MEDTFRKRGKGYEAKFKLDEEMRFKAESRRNKLLALWIAERLGMNSAETETYVTEVILSDLEEPGIDDVVRKVVKDCEERKVPISEPELRAEIERLDAIALKQIGGEYPDPLGPDHGPVGG